MTIAYLMNTYPLTSTTFIRREMHALESLGMTVKRFAIRRWNQRLVDDRDNAEIPRTEYLLHGNQARLVLSFLADVLTRPSRVARALGPWIKLVRHARGGWVRHVAYLLQACYLVHRARQAGISHIHVHFGTNATAVAMLCRVMGGPSYSFTVHGPDELVDPLSLAFPLKIRHAAWVVAISEYCRRRLQSCSEPIDHSKIRVVHCGVELGDLERFRRPQPGNQQLVCVGRLCPQKGQIHIPQAVAALRDEFPGLRVVLVGDGEDRAAIEAEIARHGVSQQVQLLGWQPNARACELIAGSRGLLLPSYAEGLPVVLMEAMALERPVITTTIAGIPELVAPGQTGWLVAPGDVPALARAIREILQRSPAELAEMGRAARARVLAEHDVVREAQKLKTQVLSVA